ncbi:hypothetical protein EDD18DRAFT_788811 [Armillaria luteobubalina]|uniref:DUF6534 domain-containing protein n=1 Tax=Armillaria luteobubalina TaxID=153913 RepID=A0AA39QDX6_9AGAR|nr:hypothetical protein EDD18DRAFT_788811 [Armillaria luteobubalina]
MGLYDQSLGAILIGSWFNAMLYMLELWQGYIFFSTFRGDALIVRLMVIISLVVDTLGTANNCACIYLYTVTHWGDMTYILVQNWAVPTYVILSGISACNVQLFLSYRFWTLTKNTFITGTLITFSLASLGGAIANGITVVYHSDYAQRDFNIKTVTIWLVASAVADISIACALIIQLRSSKPVFKETKALIRRLTIMAMQTGTVTTTLAIICLILYLVNTESNITVGFGFCLGRVYALTMLFNLNTRLKGRRHADDTTIFPPDSGSGGYRLRNVNTSDLGGISVHRTAIVRIDGSEEFRTENGNTPDVDKNLGSDDKSGAPV